MKVIGNILLFTLLMLFGGAMYLGAFGKGLLINDQIEKDSTGRQIIRDCIYFTGTSVIHRVPTNLLLTSCPLLIDR